MGWSNPLVVAGFVASLVLALLFVWQERRAAQPMLPLSLFGHRLFALTSLVGLLVNVAFYGLIFISVCISSASTDCRRSRPASHSCP